MGGYAKGDVMESSVDHRHSIWEDDNIGTGWVSKIHTNQLHVSPIINLAEDEGDVGDLEHVTSPFVVGESFHVPIIVRGLVFVSNSPLATSWKKPKVSGKSSAYDSH